MRAKRAALIDQYIAALLHDPTATPPSGLDGATARAVRAVMAAQATPEPSVHTRQRVWEQALTVAGGRAESAQVARPQTSTNGRRALSSNEAYERARQPAGVRAKKHMGIRQHAALSLIAAVVGVVIFGGILLAAFNANNTRGPNSMWLSGNGLRTRFEYYIDDVWNAGNTESLDSFLTADHVYHVPGLPEIKGVPGMAEYVTDLRTAFPGAQFDIMSIDSTKDGVRARLAVSVNQDDSLALSNGVILTPTGQPISFTMQVEAQFDDDQIAALEAQPDGVGLWLMMDTMPSLAAGDDLEHMSQRIDTVLQVDQLLNQSTIRADDLTAIASLDLVVHDTTRDGVPVERDYTAVLAGQLVPDPLPDRLVSAERIFARGDLIAVQIVAQGTADDPLWREWIELYRFEEDTIVEMWRFWHRGFYAAPTGN